MTFGLVGICYYRRASKAVVRRGVASVSTACGGKGPPKKTDVSTGRGAAVPKGTVTRFGRGLSFFLRWVVPHPHLFSVGGQSGRKVYLGVLALVSTFFR